MNKTSEFFLQDCSYVVCTKINIDNLSEGKKNYTFFNVSCNCAEKVKFYNISLPK